MSNIEDFDVNSEEHAEAMKKIDAHVKKEFKKRTKLNFDQKLTLDDIPKPKSRSDEDRMMENIEQHEAEPERELSLEEQMIQNLEDHITESK